MNCTSVICSLASGEVLQYWRICSIVLNRYALTKKNRLDLNSVPLKKQIIMKILQTIVFFSFLSLALTATSCKQDPTPAKKKSANKEQKAHKKPLSHNDQKQIIVKKLMGWKSDVDHETKRLQTEMQNSTGETKKRLQTQLKALERWGRKLEGHKRNVEKATPERWKKVKNQANKALRDIEKEWREVFSNG